MKVNKTNRLNHMPSFQINNYSVRSEVYEGVEHLVAPVVLMTEGVHHGSGGPILYLAEELSQFPSAWNGRPLPVQHPTDATGNFISANAPETLTDWSVGQLHNVRWDSDAGKLRGEIWVSVERASRVAPEVLEYLRGGRALEVSTGLFADDEPVSGEHNGEQYTSIARNIRSDHLALLPGGTGACSYADGCGVRANASNQGEEPMKVNLKKGEDAFSVHCGIGKDAGWMERLVASVLGTNEQGFQEIGNKLQRHLDSLDGPNGVHWLEEFYSDHLVYRVNQGDSQKLYKVTYQIDNAGQVQFEGEPQEVRRDTSYIDVTSNQDGETPVKTATASCGCGEGATPDTETPNNNATEEEQMNEQRKDLLDGLRANNRISITDADQENLMAMESCEEFGKHLADLIAANTEAPAADAADAADVEEEEAPAAEAPTDVNTFIESAPAEMRESLREGVRANEALRADLIGKIKGNSANTFSDAALAAMDNDALRGLAALASAATPAAEVSVPNYAGNGGAPAVTGNSQVEAMEAPVMNFAKD